MNPPEIEFYEQVVLGIYTAQFFGCALLWYQKWKFRSTPMLSGVERNDAIQSWSQKWVDLAIILWVAFFSFFAVSIVSVALIKWSGDDSFVGFTSGEEPSWGFLLMSLGIQLALLTTIAVGKRPYSIRYFSGSSSQLDAFLNAFGYLIRYLPLLWITTMVSIYLADLLGIRSGEQESVEWVRDMQNYGKLLYLMVLAIGVAPFFEELVFRGMILRFLVSKMHSSFALGISAFLFALIHMNVDSFLPIMLLGVLLGRIYLKTRDLRCAVWVHVLFNTNTMIMLAVERYLGGS